MKKIVELIKNNKKLVLFFGLLILILISLLIIAFCKDTKENTENKYLKEDTYIIYVKINPLIKLTINEISTCVSNKCTYQKNEVISYEYLNNDAKEIYKNLNLSNMNTLEALGLVGKYAVDNDVEFENIEIITNWKFKYTKDQILNEIRKETKSSLEILIDINEKENIDEESLLENEGINYYNVTFNSNGGTKVNNQTVVENSKVIKPKNPTKDGYTFSYWQLDNKKYDFKSEVTRDLVLVAVWEKKNEKTTNNKDEVTKKIEEITTKKVESTTKSEEIKKEETTTKVISKINLNDNVKYYTATDCAEYIYVNPECLNTPIRDLKVKFPNYDKYLDQYHEEMYQECLINAQNPQEECFKYDYESDMVKLTESYNYFTISYFNECDDVSVPSSIFNTLKYGIKGVTIYSNDNSHFKFEYLRFKDEKYYSFITQYPSFSKYGLLMNGGCGGGGGTPTYQILDEATCKKFNLDCDRW